MDEPLPLMGAPDAPSEDEYQAFVLALSESARGRALLAEHARRSRAADSDMLLTSVQRLEGLVRSYTEAPPPPENPHDELRGMIEAIRGVQAELDISMLAEQVAKLATLIEGVQQRIETLAVPAAPPSPPAQELNEYPTEELAEESMPPVAFAAPEPVEVEVAAEAEAVFDNEAEPLPEPEIDFAASTEAEPAIEPAPEPALAEETAFEAMRAAEPETAEAVDDAVAEPAPPMPDVAWPAESTAAEPAPPAVAAPAAGLAISALVETLVVPAADDDEPEGKIYKAGTIPPPPPFAGEDFGPRSRAVPPPLDPLADIKALTEDERLALFT